MNEIGMKKLLCVFAALTICMSGCDKIASLIPPELSKKLPPQLRNKIALAKTSSQKTSPRKTSYIVVYGRKTCSLTGDCLSELNKSGLPYTFKDIDEKIVQDDLYPRMRKAGLSTGRFGLPVVEVNGKILIRPEAETISALYGKPAAHPFISLGKKTPVASEDPLQITGITMGNPPLAIVGGNVVKVGDMVGMFEIIEIQPNSVSFRDTSGNVKKILFP